MLIVSHRNLSWNSYGMLFSLYDTVCMQLLEYRFPKERFCLYMTPFLKVFIINCNLSFACVCMFSMGIDTVVCNGIRPEYWVNDIILLETYTVNIDVYSRVTACANFELAASCSKPGLFVHSNINWLVIQLFIHK